jgi:hypothetical protein
MGKKSLTQEQINKLLSNVQPIVDSAFSRIVRDNNFRVILDNAYKRIGREAMKDIDRTFDEHFEWWKLANKFLADNSDDTKGEPKLE